MTKKQIILLGYGLNFDRPFRENYMLFQNKKQALNYKPYTWGVIKEDCRLFKISVWPHKPNKKAV